MGFTHAFNQDVSPIPGTSLVRSDGGRNYSNGAGLGHRAALIVGVLEVGAGIGGDAAAVVGEAVSFGAATPAAIPLAIGSTGLILHGGSTISKSLDNMKSEGKYSDLKEPRNVGEGKSFTPAQKKRILEENKTKNNGKIKSDTGGGDLNSRWRLFWRTWRWCYRSIWGVLA